MKIIHLLVVSVIVGAASAAAAQTKTFILVRHAEKAAAGTMDTSGDVELSAEGRERAIRFRDAVKRYRPGQVFATIYKRTQQTAQPIAASRGRTVEIYDAAKQADLVANLLKSRTKRFVIVGHSNTIPPLANLLAKKDLFKNFADNEYGVYYVIRIRKGAFRRLEVFPY